MQFGLSLYDLGSSFFSPLFSVTLSFFSDLKGRQLSIFSDIFEFYFKALLSLNLSDYQSEEGPSVAFFYNTVKMSKIQDSYG